MIAPVSSITPSRWPVAIQVDHNIPRSLLRLRDRAEEHTELDGTAIQKWLDFECEALRLGVDPDIGRDALAAAMERSTDRAPAAEHRDLHEEDVRCRGRRGGLATARRYGTAWYSLLAHRRWGRLSADDLARSFRILSGGALDEARLETKGAPNPR